MPVSIVGLGGDEGSNNLLSTDPIPPPEEYIEATTFIEPRTTVSPPPTTCDASTSPPLAPPLRTSAEVAVQVMPMKVVS
ncbi:hypothetical protein EV426DRAFT_707461 [Tirmania nivea]|nr:hypothetical protein EV426DRAFT_707461 [Tirmania nivea]